MSTVIVVLNFSLRLFTACLLTKSIFEAVYKIEVYSIDTSDPVR